MPEQRKRRLLVYVVEDSACMLPLTLLAYSFIHSLVGLSPHLPLDR